MVSKDDSINKLSITYASNNLFKIQLVINTNIRIFIKAKMP